MSSASCPRHPSRGAQRSRPASGRRGPRGARPLPVEIEDVPAERLPEPVEAAAYYLIAEALTNVAKYAAGVDGARRDRRDRREARGRRVGRRRGRRRCGSRIRPARPRRSGGVAGRVARRREPLRVKDVAARRDPVRGDSRAELKRSCPGPTNRNGAGDIDASGQRDSPPLADHRHEGTGHEQTPAATAAPIIASPHRKPSCETVTGG